MSGTAMEYAAYIPGGALLLPALTAGRLRRPRSAPAEAADKRAVPCDAPTVPGYLGKRTPYTIPSRPGKGKRRAWCASAGFYEAAEVGERGSLTWQGARLVGFEREDA
ncbi:MAG TPA: hypothetical protein H9684_06635 [Firmicutes bacterium]|nr:hypothetical protein [Bacillota bacterium]